MSKQRTGSDRYLVAAGGNTGTGVIATPIALNASGYDRVLFSIARGAEVGGTKGTFAASVYESSATGGSYALRSGSLGTSGTAFENTVLLIEINVAGATPFLKLYGTATTSGTGAIPIVAQAQLYRGSRLLPPSPDIAVISA